MITAVSVKGQTVIPEAIRNIAQIKAGDQLDVGYSNGLIVMRKRRALTPERVRSLLLAGRDLPEITNNDEAVVAAAVQRVRAVSELESRFDTNVVARASFWRGAPFDCLVAWTQGRCEAAVSPALLAEYHETIDELRREYPDRRCAPWADVLSESAELVFPTQSASGATADPFDEMILECAVAAGADFIVTGDKKHLRPLQQFQGILLVSPSEFVRKLANP